MRSFEAGVTGGFEPAELDAEPSLQTVLFSRQGLELQILCTLYHAPLNHLRTVWLWAALI
jgi:hypothetical protein